MGRAVVAVEITGGCLVAAYLVWSAYANVMASERLKVDHVDVRGSRFLSEGEVRELLGPAVGENILGLDIDSLKGRLRASPWVADATVVRTLPDTLRVDIRERQPLALAELERLYLMDGGGAEVSEVEVERSGDLKVVLRGRGELLRMGPPPYRERLLTFLGLREDLARRCPDAEWFDLRFRDRIVVKDRTPPPPAPRKPSPAAAAPAPDPAAEEPPPESAREEDAPVPDATTNAAEDAGSVQKGS
jgi:hypothetical protein